MRSSKTGYRLIGSSWCGKQCWHLENCGKIPVESDCFCNLASPTRSSSEVFCLSKLFIYGWKLECCFPVDESRLFEVPSWLNIAKIHPDHAFSVQGHTLPIFQLSARTPMTVRILAFLNQSTFMSCWLKWKSKVIQVTSASRQIPRFFVHEAWMYVALFINFSLVHLWSPCKNY